MACTVRCVWVDGHRSHRCGAAWFIGELARPSSRSVTSIRRTHSLAHFERVRRSFFRSIGRLACRASTRPSSRRLFRSSHPRSQRQSWHRDRAFIRQSTSLRRVCEARHEAGELRSVTNASVANFVARKATLGWGTGRRRRRRRSQWPHHASQCARKKESSSHRYASNRRTGSPPEPTCCCRVARRSLGSQPRADRLTSNVLTSGRSDRACRSVLHRPRRSPAPLRRLSQLGNVHSSVFAGSALAKLGDGRLSSPSSACGRDDPRRGHHLAECRRRT